MILMLILIQYQCLSLPKLSNMPTSFTTTIKWEFRHLTIIDFKYSFANSILWFYWNNVYYISFQPMTVFKMPITTFFYILYLEFTIIGFSDQADTKHAKGNGGYKYYWELRPMLPSQDTLLLSWESVAFTSFFYSFFYSALGMGLTLSVLPVFHLILHTSTTQSGLYGEEAFTA